MEAREEGKERKTSTETESHEWKENIQRKPETDFPLCERLLSEYAISAMEILDRETDISITGRN